MQDTQSGCYSVCTNCHIDGNCCSLFDKINAPVLNKEELIQLREVLKSDDFYDVVDNNFDCLDDLIEKIKPWIIEYTDDRNYTKMKRLKYTVIKEIKE